MPGPSEHEQKVGDFYSEFPYPWHVTRLAAPNDATLYPALVAQELGDFGRRRMPANARIWVPGCGVNQALIMALQFPGAQVVGSDVSEESLDMCRAAARQTDVTNLVLRDEGIAEAGYDAEFDYIACTGVIHHHPDPSLLLRRVGAALKPDGILELMIYNVFHRREITAFQEAMRLLGKEQDLLFARRLANSLTTDNGLRRQLRDELGEPEEQFADTWLNPCERNFSVRSLHEMASGAGLELEAPCVSRLSAALDLYDWSVPFQDAKLAAYASTLDDATRWQVCQLLKIEHSPLLWFYLRRMDSPRPTMSEAERDTAFLDSVVSPVHATERVWTLGRSGGYQKLGSDQAVAAGPSRYPEVVSAADGVRTVGEICAVLGRPAEGEALRRMRIELTTPAFPYLRSSPS